MKILLATLLLGISINDSFAGPKSQLISLRAGETQRYQYTRIDTQRVACTEISTGGEDCVTINHYTTYRFALSLKAHGDFNEAQLELKASGHTFRPVRSDLAVVVEYVSSRDTGTFDNRSIELGVNIYPYHTDQVRSLAAFEELEVKNGVITFTTTENSSDVFSGILIQKRKLLFLETIISANLKPTDIVTTATPAGFRHEIDLRRFNLKEGVSYRLSFHRNIKGGDSFPNTYNYVNTRFKL